MNDIVTTKLAVLEEYQSKLNLDDLELGRIFSFPASYTTEYQLNAYIRKFVKQKKGGYNRPPSIPKSLLVLLEIVFQLETLGFSSHSVKPDYTTGLISNDSWNGQAIDIGKKLARKRPSLTLPDSNLFFANTRKYFDLDKEAMAILFFELNDIKDAKKRITKIESPTAPISVKLFDVYLCHMLAFAFSQGIDPIEINDVVTNKISL